MLLLPTLSLILSALTLSARALPQVDSATILPTSLPAPSSGGSSDSGSVSLSGTVSIISSAISSLSSTATSSSASSSATSTGGGVVGGPPPDATTTSSADTPTETGTQPANITSSGPDVSGGSLNFGSNFAVLFLDYVSGIVGGVNTTTEGETFLNNTQQWSQAVHQLSPKPFIGYSQLALGPQQFEVADLPWGFSQAISGNNYTAGSEASQLVPQAGAQSDDFVFNKFRYSAAYGNSLIPALQAQNVTTVVLSGIRISGVILSTAYALFDSDFRVFILSDVTIEPTPNSDAIKTAVLGPDGIVPKLPANVITLDEALQAIGSA